MDAVQLIDLANQAWQPHPTLKGVLTKVIENSASNPLADSLMAKVEPGGAIPWHVHTLASETAIVLDGHGVLYHAPEQRELDQATRVPLTQGSAVRVSSGEWHIILNDGAEAMLLVAFHTPPTF